MLVRSTFYISISLLLLLPSNISCSKILCIVPLGAKSTFSFQQQTIKTLVNRGHEVTVISKFPQKQKILNYTDLDISSVLYTYTDTASVTGSRPNVFTTLKIDYEIQLTNCKNIYANDKILAFVNSNVSFDLVIVELDDNLKCLLPLAFAFKAPVVGSTSGHFIPPVSVSIMGNPTNPAYIPNIFSGFSIKMNFCQRVSNSLQLLLHWAFAISQFCGENDIARKCIPHTPTIEQLLRNVSLYFTNEAEYVVPRPRAPNLISISGIHMKEDEPLPKDIENFINGAENGVIYVSLGSIVKFSSFPKNQHDAFVNVFSKLIYRVLWKHDKPELVESISPNLLIRKWFPQTNILAEKKVILFLGHCGLLGILEAIYYQTPIIGMPVIFDQFTNVAMVEELEIGLRVNVDSVNEEILQNTIDKILNVKKYGENMKKVSQIYRDRAMKPNETLIYWVEYVIRHKGAPHLKSAGAELPFYQYLLLDVILFLIMVLFLSTLFIYFVFKIIRYHLTIRRRIKAVQRRKRDSFVNKMK